MVKVEITTVYRAPVLKIFFFITSRFLTLFYCAARPNTLAGGIKYQIQNVTAKIESFSNAN